MCRTLAIPFAAFALLIAGASTSVGQQRPDPPGRLVDAGGHKVHLFCQGQGSPTVILEPTIGGFSIDWALVQTALSGKVPVCSWDRAGSAWSDMSAHFGEFDAEARDLSFSLRSAGIPPPYVLAAHAYGALFARNFQRLYPGEVSGMVLVDSLFEEQGSRISFETGLPAPLLDFSEKNLRESLAADPRVEFTPASRRPAADSLQKLPPALRSARSWADEKWTATLRHVTLAQWTAIMESTMATYGALYRARHGSDVPLGKLPLVLITTSGEADAERETAFAHLSENGHQIFAPRSGYPSPLEQPELVVEAILKVFTAAQASRVR